MEISYDTILKEYSAYATDEWARPINLREDPEDPEAITELRQLAHCMAENPDMVHGNSGLIGVRDTIHSVRDGLIRKGLELMNRDKDASSEDQTRST